MSAVKTMTPQARERLAALAKRRRAESIGRQLALLLWVKAAARWLADNRCTAAEAAAFAREDGLAFATPRRVSLAYSAAMNDDPATPRPEPIRDKRDSLSRVQWDRICNAIRRHAAKIEPCETSAQVAGILESAARIRRPLAVIDEALRAMGPGFARAMRDERPKFC